MVLFNIFNSTKIWHKDFKCFVKEGFFIIYSLFVQQVDWKIMWNIRL